MDMSSFDFISIIINSIIALTTIITLGFLLWQTVMLRKQLEIANKESKLSNLLAKNQAYQFRYQLFMEMDKIILDNPELKKLISNKKFTEKYQNGELNDKASKEIAFIELVMNLVQLTYFQYEDNLRDSELVWVEELLHNQHIQSYWDSDTKCEYRTDFKNYIDSKINTLNNNTITHAQKNNHIPNT